MKKIALLTQYFYPENVTTGNLAYQTADYLQKNGIDVTVFSGKSKIYCDEKKVKTKEVKDGIKIRRIRYFNTKKKSKINRLISYFSFMISSYLNLFRLKNYDLLVVYSSPPILPKIAILANKLFSTKIIFVSYDVYPEIAINMGAIKENGIIAKFTNKMNKKLYKRVDRVVALSNEMKDFLVKVRNINENKVVVIPNWHEDLVNDSVVEYKLFNNYKNNGDLVVSYFGNLGILQDIKTIVESAKTTTNTKVKYLFAGHGVKVKYLKEEIEKNNLGNIKYYDYLKGNDFKEAVNISDVYIVSLEKEGTGLAVPSKTYSYLMGGKPLIAIMDKNTDIAKELIEFNAGFVVEHGDTAEFNRIIDLLANNKNLALEMGNNARKLYLDKYTIEVNVEKYKEIIVDILDNK